MRLTMIVPIVQLMGVLIPLIGCIVMFRREQIKASMSRVFTNMSLMITNIGCLIMNASYWLLLWSETEEGAWIASPAMAAGSRTVVVASDCFGTKREAQRKLRHP